MRKLEAVSIVSDTIISLLSDNTVYHIRSNVFSGQDGAYWGEIPLQAEIQRPVAMGAAPQTRSEPRRHLHLRHRAFAIL